MFLDLFLKLSCVKPCFGLHSFAHGFGFQETGRPAVSRCQEPEGCRESVGLGVR